MSTAKKTRTQTEKSAKISSKDEIKPDYYYTEGDKTYPAWYNRDIDVYKARCRLDGVEYFVYMPVSTKKDPVHRMGEIVRKCKNDYEVRKGGRLVRNALQTATINDFDITYVCTH